MIRIAPHLTFDGQCREAIQMYQQIFGGTIATMLTYGDSPIASQIDPRWHSRIVHATLQFGESEFTGADLMPHDYRKPEGFFVTVTIEEATLAEKIFQQLAQNGEVRLPFQSTFWSPGFGVVIDQYGVPWEINSAGSAAST